VRMSQEGKQTLLVVLPGASGRKPVLQRLQAFAHICVLVPSSDKRSDWARELVGEDLWIEWEGTAAAFDVAHAAIQAWLAAASGRCINGIMTYDEFGVELCARLGEHLGVPCTPLETIQAFRDKARFRERCSAAGLPAVRHARLRAQDDVQSICASGNDSFRFPCVLKPVKGAGSWHISRVDSAEELQAVSARLRQELQGNSFPQEIREAGFVLEEYFAGHEVDVDGWARDGKIEYMVISDNRPAVEPHFLEMGGVYPSQLPPPALQALEELTKQVVAAFPGIHTCFHFEAKINVETLEAMPIEFNARCGGAECPASIEAITGYYLPEVAARLALGLAVPRASPKHAVVASTNLHIFEQGVVSECSDEAVDAEACRLVCSVLLAAPGKLHVPNNGSMSCLGWVAAGGRDAKEAELHLQKAVGQLRLRVTPEGASGSTSH